MSDTYTKLGESLRIVRWHAGLSQVALAESLGISRGAVRHYEAGRRKPSLDVLDAWARACGYRFCWHFA